MINQQIPLMVGGGWAEEGRRRGRREGLCAEKGKEQSLEATAVGGELWAEETEKSEEGEVWECGSEGSGVSFEEDILEEHKAVMEREMGRNAWFFGEGGKIFKNLSLDGYLQQLLGGLRGGRCAGVERWQLRRRQQPSLEKFLLFVYHSFPHRAVSKTLKLFFLVWELYLPYLSMHLDQLQIHSLAADIARRIHSQQTAASRYLHLHSAAFLGLLTTVATTFLCVVEKLFHNCSLTASPRRQEQQEGQGERAEDAETVRKCRKLDVSPLLV